VSASRNDPYGTTSPRFESLELAANPGTCGHRGKYARVGYLEVRLKPSRAPPS